MTNTLPVSTLGNIRASDMSYSSGLVLKHPSFTNADTHSSSGNCDKNPDEILLTKMKVCKYLSSKLNYNIGFKIKMVQWFSC